VTSIHPTGQEALVGKVTASFFISLDGVVEAPETWHTPWFDDEMGATIGQAMASTGAFLLGRRTYEEWAAYWPQQDPGANPMAGAINGLPRYVASRTLREAAWQGSTVLGGELAEEVPRLKERHDGDVAISGSATLVRSLVEAGLLDELRVMVHPVLVGRGARLFEDAPAPASLELAESRAFGSGVLSLTYRPVHAGDGPGTGGT
jgi:dihydrofolate reductase